MGPVCTRILIIMKTYLKAFKMLWYFNWLLFMTWFLVSLFKIRCNFLVVSVKKLSGAIEVNFDDGTNIRFEDCWLRDHCRCSSCYNSATFQRAQHLLAIPESNIKESILKNTELFIKWDDGHETTYPSDFLIQFDYKNWKGSRKLKPILWRGPTVSEKIARINVVDFLDTEQGPKAVFQSLLDYGVAVIDGVEATVEATEEVCEALGGVQHTLFGGMWRFTTVAQHADTAYTNLPLAVHNDNTYFTEAAGLQVLHCIEHLNPVGGETILVDGFFGAEQLRGDDPDSFTFLTTFDVEAEYLEDGHHHRFSAPVISVDRKTQDLKQIRFNVYDRSAMAFSRPDECRAYYRSLRKLGQYYEDPKNQWQFKLRPGTVLVMDNFRVLHGRTGFSGQRVLCGSYVSRSDWLNKARNLRLIN